MPVEKKNENGCTTEPLIRLYPPTASANLAAKKRLAYRPERHSNSLRRTPVRRPDIILHQKKYFSNHLIASQLQQQLATSSHPVGRPNRWLMQMCPKLTLYAVATRAPRSAWKCQQQPTFLAADWSQKADQPFSCYCQTKSRRGPPLPLFRAAEKAPQNATISRRFVFFLMAARSRLASSLSSTKPLSKGASPYARCSNGSTCLE